MSLYVTVCHCMVPLIQDGKLQSTFTVDIDVTGYNDELPVFESPIYYITVTELEVGADGQCNIPYFYFLLQ